MHLEVNNKVHISFHAGDKNAVRATLSPLQNVLISPEGKGCPSFQFLIV